jgi:hypothetical protein
LRVRALSRQFSGQTGEQSGFLHSAITMPIRIGILALCAALAQLTREAAPAMAQTPEDSAAVAGVDKGIRRVSEVNVVLAIGLMIYVAIFENPIRVLNSLIMNIGDYLSRFPGMTLNTFAYDQPTEWLNAWTLFFWAWWIAWAPFVGMFIARISRGRTIRQFVTATLVVPLLYTLTFLSVFGNRGAGSSVSRSSKTMCIRCQNSRN